MEHLRIIEMLKQTSLFDLYRLEVMLMKMLTEPKRLNEVRAKLQPNQEIYYFEPSINQEIPATILNLGRTYAWVQNQQDGRKWRIPYYMINTGAIKIDSSPNSGKVDRLTLKVGERVGFVNRQNLSLYGTVIKLNEKTATVKLSTGAGWRVPYNMLFYVMDAVTIKGDLLNDQSSS